MQNNIKVSPVFMRWQVQCETCGTYFYVDTEAETTRQEVDMILDEMDCEEHPAEQNVLELA